MLIEVDKLTKEIKRIAKKKNPTKEEIDFLKKNTGVLKDCCIEISTASEELSN